MLEYFKKLGVASLVISLLWPLAVACLVILIGMTEPIECLVSAVFCGAVCFTISAGMFAAILTKTWVVQADIKSGKIFENTPTWINDCLDIDIRLTEAQI